MRLKVGSVYEMQSGNILKVIEDMGDGGFKIEYIEVKNFRQMSRSDIINNFSFVKKELPVLGTELYKALNGE
jgi:hypothetical protein